MRLTDLEPVFLKREKQEDGVHHIGVDGIAEAQGIMFLCPLCFEGNKGPVGTHHIICWSRLRGIPDDAAPLPGRWSLVGTGFADLTLVGEGPTGQSSVKLTSGCMWHGNIVNGEVSTS